MNFDLIIINGVLLYLENKNVHKYYITIFNILFNIHK